MQVRVAAQRLPVRDAASAQIQMVWVLVGESVEPREALAHDMLTGSLQQEGLLVLLALGIVWLGVRRGLRPLRQLSASVAARNADELAPLPQHGLPAEVTPLVAAINQYVARLLRMLDARKRFFADAAHQLKTPLAVIQAQSELAPLARRAGIDLGFEGEPATVAAEPQWLQELVGNLLDNAIRYAGHDARVTLRVARQTAPGQDACALLQVEDNGPGIAAQAQEGSGLTVSVRFAEAGHVPVG